MVTNSEKNSLIDKITIKREELPTTVKFEYYFSDKNIGHAYYSVDKNLQIISDINFYPFTYSSNLKGKGIGSYLFSLYLSDINKSQFKDYKLFYKKNNISNSLKNMLKNHGISIDKDDAPYLNIEFKKLYSAFSN
jgi:hypothetical protein